MARFVLSLIGSDRTGLVEALADVVVEHGGNWERSHVTELRGNFAGLVLVSVPGDRVAEFRDAVGRLREDGLLDVTVRPAADGDRADADAETATTMSFALVGTDRPGIVRDVSRLLVELDVSIDDLRSWTSSAAMAGGTLFEAEAVVRLPGGLSVDDLVARLESLANDLMVDVTPIVVGPG